MKDTNELKVCIIKEIQLNKANLAVHSTSWFKKLLGFGNKDKVSY